MNFVLENKRAISLAIVVLSLILILAWPKGLAGSMFIVSVSLFSGVMASLIFIQNSVRELKEIAEKMTDDYELKN